MLYFLFTTEEYQSTETLGYIMKIGLHLGDDMQKPSKRGPKSVPEKIILATKNGDWTAKNQLTSAFSPLITSLAEKRATDSSETNTYIEAGNRGLIAAAKKYKSSIGADKFQVFALDFIDAHMNRLSSGGGFFSRLFGK